MKKKVIATSAVLGLAALVLGGGTLAYFTDHDEITNRFTVGKVEIELIESQLHRANAGVANGSTSDSLLWTPGINKAGTQDNTSSVRMVTLFGLETISQISRFSTILQITNTTMIATSLSMLRTWFQARVFVRLHTSLTKVPLMLMFALKF